MSRSRIIRALVRSTLPIIAVFIGVLLLYLFDGVVIDWYRQSCLGFPNQNGFACHSTFLFFTMVRDYGAFLLVPGVILAVWYGSRTGA
jgi:hypothetical protein